MNRIKPAGILAFVLVTILNFMELAQAQIELNRQLTSQQRIPPVDGSPPEREPAGSRGGCEMTDMPFTPFLPVTNSEFSGYTLAEHPTFWFYVPYKTDKVKSGHFSLSLEGDSDNNLYETTVKFPETPGFVSISIPLTEKSLEKNQKYRWKFRIVCASDDSSLSVYHTGTVERTDLPGFETQVKTATLGERINLYVRNKIWYDVSADLAKIYSTPQAWLNLLDTIGLKQLAQVPIAGAAVPIEPEKQFYLKSR